MNVTIVVFQKLYVELVKNLVASVAAKGILDGAKIDLGQVDVNLTPNTVIADLTPGIATYTGYAQALIVWSAPTLADDGTIEVIGTIPEFRPTDGVAPNVIHTFWVTAGIGGALLFAGKFAAPGQAMNSALTNLSFALKIKPGLDVPVSIIE